MKILLIGRNGQVAWELRRTLACLGNVIALDRHSSPLEIDLLKTDSICAAVRAIGPRLIVNAAAYTAVDRAEQEREPAWQVNASAPALLAELSAELGIGLIHYSTDYVFAGDAHAPYGEDSETAPQSVYGSSKLAGEKAIAESGIPHLILRTAWVYGGRGANFLLTMLRLMREKDVLRVVSDQVGAPTWSRLIAEATAALIVRSSENEAFAPGDKSGVYHLSCGGETSWYDFACHIKALSQAAGILPEACAVLEAIPSADYPTAAKRPAYSVLSNAKLAREFGLQLPGWELALELCLADYAQGMKV
jgi:dTDP-4-dehydrorhamnose reductase